MMIAGFDVRLRPRDRYVTVEDYRRAARRRLPDFVWAYLDGGAEDLVTLRGNRTGFSAWSLRAHMLTGNGKPDLSTEAMGEKLSLPVMIAPTGYSGLVQWDGDICAAKAAAKAGTRHVLSTASSWSIEEVATAVRGHMPGFQLYPREGELAANLMRRAWSAGYHSLFVTVDVPAVGLREGEKRMGFSMPPVLAPKALLDIAMHPRWAVDVLRHKRVSGRNFVNGGKLSDAAESLAIQTRYVTQAALSWEDLAWMRDQWKGRLYVKGILEPGDAEKAVALGAEGVVVSNHGGRQLEYALPSITALPGVVAAVAGRAEVLLDSGVRRGTDVVKAVALGATAVLVGRPYLYGLAVEGQAGIEKVLEIFRSEIERTLILMGVKSVRDLTPDHLIPRDGRSDDSDDPSTRFAAPVRPHAPGA
ncbi:alpha-hydroxy acid oxidase [Falsiroseomonas sp. HW251]|uniref:alpha-hydroxy acid oxidase n=1 Tax=Falsiroseomonas sp. HW251 TaxID=3390998 RepID=UPI003D321AC5